MRIRFAEAHAGKLLIGCHFREVQLKRRDSFERLVNRQQRIDALAPDYSAFVTPKYAEAALKLK